MIGFSQNNSILLNNGSLLEFSTSSIQLSEFDLSIEEGYSTCFINGEYLISNGNQLARINSDNKNVEVLDDNLIGNPSSAQAALFLPISDSILFLLTNSASGKNSNIYLHQIQYSEGKWNVLDKNQLFFQNVTEHLAVFETDSGYKVASFQQFNGGLHLADLKFNGVFNRSIIPIYYPGVPNFRSKIGQLKFSSDGKFVAATFLELNLVVKFRLSEHFKQLISTEFYSEFTQPYGIEFTASNEILVSTWNHNAENSISIIYQNNEVQTLYSTNQFDLGAIQNTQFGFALCPKIGSRKVLRIDFGKPGVPIIDSIDVSGKYNLKAGLAGYPSSFFQQQFPFELECNKTIRFNDTVICGGVEFSLPDFKLRGGKKWTTTILEEDDLLKKVKYELTVQDLACTYTPSFIATTFLKNRLKIDVEREGTGVRVFLNANNGKIEVNGRAYTEAFRTEIDSIFYIQVEFPECIIKERLEIII